ncbi:MAG: dihydroneopterin aldolase [Bacteroides sp.]
MQNEKYIFLDKIKLFAYHGVSPQETIVGNTFIIDLKLKVDFSDAAKTDDLRFTVSYADIYHAVKEEMQIPSKLLENVCYRIIKRLFHDFSLIENISIKLSKQNPPMGADIEGAGVIINCDRDCAAS